MSKNQHSQKIEEILNRIKTGEKSPRSMKKRRLSRIFLLVDGIIIVLILIFFYQKESPTHLYHSTNINYDNCNYRISSMQNEEQGLIRFSFTITSKSETKKLIKYLNKIAQIKLLNNNKVLQTGIIGKNVKKIELEPGETKTFVLEIETNKIQDYAKENPNLLVSATDSFLSFKQTDLPINANIEIFTDKNLSTTLKLYYKVK